MASPEELLQGQAADFRRVEIAAPQHQSEQAGGDEALQQGGIGWCTDILAGLRIFLPLDAERQHDEQAEEPAEEIDDELRRNLARGHACSNSIKVPTKSFGCRKSTGLSWAPIFGSPSPST